MLIPKRRMQEPIGFNVEEKKLIKNYIKKINQNAPKGSIKVTFSSFVRDAALEKCK